MTNPLIVVGDKTDHGGVVLTGSSVTLVDGKPVACVGDSVSCPRKGHGSTTVIATGSSGMAVDGRMVARHGDKTACGATLLSSQVETSNA
ncbi:PAAR domain-containing protein [Comamonas sp. GB3 AK4-5]|uniref:PAAR domain-containing protein n=1 Tax=Comamonas sp. GB3 AK4-5 TaxID=3231487 RepID=UPI00351E33EF